MVGYRVSFNPQWITICSSCPHECVAVLQVLPDVAHGDFPCHTNNNITLSVLRKPS